MRKIEKLLCEAELEALIYRELRFYDSHPIFHLARDFSPAIIRLTRPIVRWCVVTRGMFICYWKRTKKKISVFDFEIEATQTALEKLYVFPERGVDTARFTR